MNGTTAHISWNASSGASSYSLQRALKSAPTVYTDIGGAITGTSYDDATLTLPVTEYAYRVAATNADGTSAYSTASQLLGRRPHRRHHRQPHAVFRHALHPLGLREGAERRHPDDPGRHPHHRRHRSRRAARSGSCAARRSRPTAPRRSRSSSRRAALPGNRKPGDWGGIIIIGNGIINRTGNPIQTEGGAAGEAENYAGGTDNTDNSGTLRYVRIEFAGYDVSNGAGQELNTLSSYAVGRGTTYEYIQSMSGLDDSFEYWGGAVDGRYLVSYESGDDHFDWTEGYVGRNQFLIAFQSTRLAPHTGSGVLSADPAWLRGRRLRSAS